MSVEGSDSQEKWKRRTETSMVQKISSSVGSGVFFFVIQEVL